MAKLGVEPRPSGYILGALPLSYLALGIRWYCLYYHHCGRLDIQHAGVTTGTIELEFLGLVEIRHLVQFSTHTQINELSSIYCFT